MSQNGQGNNKVLGHADARDRGHVAYMWKEYLLSLPLALDTVHCSDRWKDSRDTKSRQHDQEESPVCEENAGTLKSMAIT